MVASIVVYSVLFGLGMLVLFIVIGVALAVGILLASVGIMKLITGSKPWE